MFLKNKGLKAYIKVEPKPLLVGLGSTCTSLRIYINVYYKFATLTGSSNMPLFTSVAVMSLALSISPK